MLWLYGFFGVWYFVVFWVLWDVVWLECVGVLWNIFVISFWENVDSRFLLKKWKIEKVIFMKVFFFKYLGICGLEFFEVYGIIVYGEREISN